jgi:ABC-2 type transport system permease protein
MRQIWGIAFYEVRHIFKDKILMLMVFLIPILYCAFLGTIYAPAILTNIPLGVVDLDHSKLSREVVASFSNTQHFRVEPAVATYQELERAMGDGEARAGLIIPVGFEQQVSEHRSSQVELVYDASNLIWGYNIRRYARTVINQFYQTHAADNLVGLGFTGTEIGDILNTVSLNTEIWYNPSLSYCNFLFPGLILLILHQIGLLSVSLTVTREKECRTWLQYLGSAIPRWKIVAGKCLPYFLTIFFNYALLLWWASSFLNMDVGGSLPLLLLLGLVYDVIITAAGFAISVRSGSSLVVTRIIMLLSMPIFFCSGFTWPLAYMPPLLRDLVRLMPYPWIAGAFRMVSQKGAGAGAIAVNLAVLVIMACLSLMFALNFSKRLSPSPARTKDCYEGSCRVSRPGGGKPTGLGSLAS